MSIWSKGVFWWVILCVVFVELVDLFTINPNVISGNGNLGLLFVVPALVVFALTARSLWKAYGNLELTFRAWLLLYFASVISLLLFSILEYNFVMKLIDDLGGSFEVANSKIYRYPVLNQYTNTMFINFYTFGMMLSAIVFVKSTIMKFKKAIN